MSIDLSSLHSSTRLLFSIPLRPVQGQRFQPTGFPSLGAATFQSSQGTSLLVESAQSMANRLEMTCWDSATHQPIDAVAGISHVRIVRQDGSFLTDTILEAHRLNSPYLLEGKKNSAFKEKLKKDVGGMGDGPINRQLLAETLLRYDIGCLLHGVFLAKPDLAGGRLRVARAMSGFIEAEGVRVAASGGVKNDHVNPSGDTKTGFGNVPFARDEYVADRIALYLSVDLAQIRGYGLGADVERLLTLLALFKIRRLIDGELRLRTACDFELVDPASVVANRPAGFSLPSSEALQAALRPAIATCASRMLQETAVYGDELKKSKATDTGDDAPSDED
jgi:CRISPR-associated protein Csb1